MATIKEVAALAGVSIGTVSNVINGRQTVSDKSRELVEDAIRRLGYRPNSAARTLKTNSSRCIGLIIPTIQNPFFPDIARGVEDAAIRLGYTVFLCNGDRDPEKEMYYVRSLSQKSIDGIVIVKAYLPLSGLEGYYRQEQVVLVDCRDELPIAHDFNAIEIDDYKGFRQAMEALYELGHRRIAYITGRLNAHNVQRLNAYLEFVKFYRLDDDPALVTHGNFDWQSGYQCARGLLALAKRPTALLAANDLMALGAMKAVLESGLTIPGDISVIGCDDIDMALLATPRLATIHTPRYEIGRLAVEMLADRLTGTTTQGSIVHLDTSLIRRESMGRVVVRE